MNDHTAFTLPHRHRRLVVPRLSSARRFAFEEIAPTSLCFLANLAGSQPRFWGDNRGGWPVLMRLSQTWEDRKSGELERNEPYQQRALITRLWCDEWDDADRLWQASYKTLRGRFEDGQSEWMSFDAETTLDVLTAAALDSAKRLRIETWTDDEMLRRFDDLNAMAQKYMEDV